MITWFRRLGYCQGLLTVLAAATIISCMQGGSGSTTTNGFTASIRDEQGVSVSNATVRIRPHDYCASGETPAASPPAEESIVDTVTDRNGIVVVGDLHPGDYAIEILTAATNEGVLIRGKITTGDMTDFGTWTVAPLGAISGSVDSSLRADGTVFKVQVYGLERYMPVDPVTGAFLIPELPPDTYTVRLIAEDSAVVPIDFETVTLPPGDTVAVDTLVTWTHHALLSINTASAGLVADDTLVNVPLMLKLGSDNFDFIAGKKKGGDLRITKNDGTAVTFETEWYDSTNFTATIWILADTLYGNRPVHTLHLYSGNRQALSVSNPAAVFDTSFGYRDVWHFNESGGTVQKDATVNNRSAIPSSTMAGENDILGLMGRAQWFKGDAESITVDNMPAPASGSAGGYEFAVFAWVKDAASVAAAHGVFSRNDHRYGLLHDGKGHWAFYGSSTGNASDSCFASASTNVWTLLVGVGSGTRNYLYVNGSVADSCVADNSAVESGGGVLSIGCLPDSTGWFTGTIDEVRIHSKALSPQWIRFCYETQREDQNVVSLKWLR